MSAGSEIVPAPKKGDLIDRDDIGDIVKSKTLVSTNKSFYKNLPMVTAVLLLPVLAFLDTLIV